MSQLEPNQYRSKEERVEGFVVLPTNLEDVAKWCGGRVGDGFVDVPTLEGLITVFIGDHILRDKTTGNFSGYSSAQMKRKFDLRIEEDDTVSYQPVRPDSHPPMVFDPEYSTEYVDPAAKHKR